jgi:hypothetical protein
MDEANILYMQHTTYGAVSAVIVRLATPWPFCSIHHHGTTAWAFTVRPEYQAPAAVSGIPALYPRHKSGTMPCAAAQQGSRPAAMAHTCSCLHQCCPKLASTTTPSVPNSCCCMKAAYNSLGNHSIDG